MSFSRRPPRHPAETRFDALTSTADKLRFALQYAILAPSSHNSQPWRFIVAGDTVTVCADLTRALPVVDPFDRELIISCGAALLNLRIALNHLGLVHAITLFPADAEPDVLAQLRVLPEGHRDGSLAPLFDAIVQRTTTREIFDDTPVSHAVQRRLIDAGAAEGVEVACIESLKERDRIAGLIAEADLLQFSDPRFRRELASWIHPRRRDDGMPAYGSGAAGLLDLTMPLAASAIRTFDLGGGKAASHRRLVDGSPLLVGIATHADDRKAWLASGQALQRILLAATTEGLTASYLNQPIETLPLRERLRVQLGLQGVPQLLLRVGQRMKKAVHAPRRPLADVVS